MKRTIEIPQWLTLAMTVRGSKDPVMVGPGETRWHTRTPDGPGALRLTRVSPVSVEAEVWGPGAEWMMNQAPRLVGAKSTAAGASL